MSKTSAIRSKILNEDEFNHLLNTVTGDFFSIRNIAMIFCSFGLGLRAGDIAKLTIKDVADENYWLLDKIIIRKKYCVYLENKKVYNALTEHVRNMVDFDRDQPLFQTQRKQAFTGNAVQKWFRTLYDRAGLLGASSHSGRKTFITRLMDQGVDIKTVSKLAGHASVNTTAIYAKAQQKSMKNIFNLAVF